MAGTNLDRMTDTYVDRLTRNVKYKHSESPSTYQ
jgi:hypothetical protein